MIQIPDPPPALSLQQALHFRRVFVAIAEKQGAIMPPSSPPISPAQWHEIAQAIAQLAAEQMAPLPDLAIQPDRCRRVGDRLAVYP